ncbi:MAG: prolipoprotein diacylglyceryl transferase [Thermoclostridium sp.]|nr:prolipoprotein diacylglyceryl transferase [Thermoclostridium sp.]
MLNHIDFPRLGIHLELNPVLFTLGPFAVHWYGIITALAFLVIITGVLRSSEKYGLKQDDLTDMLLFTAPVGIIGARIFYVVVNWELYSRNPLDIIKIWEGGLAIYGGIVLGIITIFLFCRFRKISALQVLDHIAVYLPLGQSIGRWGNFVNQELFGPSTTLPWGMTGDVIQRTTSDLVHPLFLYESLWNLAVFFVLVWFRKRKKLQGEVFSLYMVLYGCARLFIDSMRPDLRVNGVNVNQVIGGLFALAFVILLIYRRLRLKKRPDGGVDYQPSQYRSILDSIEQEQPSEPSSVGSKDTQNQEQPTKVTSDKEDSKETLTSKDHSKTASANNGDMNQEEAVEDTAKDDPDNRA